MAHDPAEGIVRPMDEGPDGDAGQTASLLARARSGDPNAREQLAARFHAPLRRWAHGRLPFSARGMLDTDDIVQNTLVRALDHLDTFEPRHEGAFLAFLRTILLNQVRDAIRRAQRRGGAADTTELLPDPGPSPLERAAGRDLLERYERALAQLSEDQRSAVIMRVELGYSFAEVAAALGRPTANAARLLVKRAIVSLAGAIRDDA